MLGLAFFLTPGSPSTKRDRTPLAEIWVEFVASLRSQMLGQDAHKVGENTHCRLDLNDFVGVK